MDATPTAPRSTAALTPAPNPARHEGRIALAWPWVLRGLWLLAPLVVVGAVGDALTDRSAAVRTAALALVWAWWALGLLATLVAHAISLVVLRLAAPALFAVSVVAAREGGLDRWSTTLALGLCAVLVVLTLSAETGHLCVNGSAYPNERRFLLRPPATLLLGPLPIAGVLLITSTALGPLLLAARQWVPGIVAVVVGVAVVVLVARALHAQTQRFAVFVPAGFVLHDRDVVRDTLMLRSSVVEAIRTAPADSDSLDLTANASGFAMEVLLHEKVELTKVRNSRDLGESGRSARFLFVPTMPGRLLATAHRLGYRTE